MSAKTGENSGTIDLWWTIPVLLFSCVLDVYYVRPSFFRFLIDFLHESSAALHDFKPLPSWSIHAEPRVRCFPSLFYRLTPSFLIPLDGFGPSLELLYRFGPSLEPAYQNLDPPPESCILRSAFLFWKSRSISFLLIDFTFVPSFELSLARSQRVSLHRVHSLVSCIEVITHCPTVFLLNWRGCVA